MDVGVPGWLSWKSVTLDLGAMRWSDPLGIEITYTNKLICLCIYGFGSPPLSCTIRMCGSKSQALHFEPICQIILKGLRNHSFRTSLLPEWERKEETIPSREWVTKRACAP